ncbi:MAG: Vgb family protein [Chthoniobacterales bacterium]
MRRVVLILWFLFLASAKADFFVTTFNDLYRVSDSGVVLSHYLGRGTGLAGEPDNFVYLADGYNARIDRLAADTGFFAGSFGSDANLISPEDLVVGVDGYLYVTSQASGPGFVGRIARFDLTTGNYLGDFVVAGSGGLQRPDGIAFGPDSNLYVSDVNLGAVLRFDGLTGAPLGTFSSGATLTFAGGIAFGPDGNLYVGDANAGRIAIFDGATGIFLRNIVTGGSPLDLVFGPDGMLYVTNFNLGSGIGRFDPATGASLGIFGDTLQIRGAAFIAYVPELRIQTLLLLGCAVGMCRKFRARRSLDRSNTN